MTGGESKVSNADIDTLLLDFMRVVLAQHELHASNEIGYQTNNVWLHLDRTAPLFAALGLTPQTPEVQWMMIFKLYRELCVDVNGSYKDLTPLDPAKIPFGFHIDYQELNTEVMLDIVPFTFMNLLSKLETAQTSHHSPATYTCRLWQDDNKLMLAINGDSFQVAKLQDGRIIGTILTRLINQPSGRPLQANEIAPLDNSFDFNQQFAKNHYKWLQAMLTSQNKRSIIMKNPSEWSHQDMLVLLSEINEKYRKPIEQHLNLA